MSIYDEDPETGLPRSRRAFENPPQSETMVFTRKTLDAYIRRQYSRPGDGLPGVVQLVNRWLARGDGVAVYENCDLGHRDAGLCQLVSFGSSAAQLETSTPPMQMPDIGSRVNWRYRLAGTYRGEPLEEEGTS